MFDHPGLDHINYILGDIGGMIADAFQMAGD